MAINKKIDGTKNMISDFTRFCWKKYMLARVLAKRILAIFRMGKTNILNDAKKFLADSYEEAECKEIIRNSLLGLRKLPLGITSFIKNRSRKKCKKGKYLVTKIKFAEDIMSAYKERCYTDFMYSTGSIVWSKLLFCESWPAIIIQANMCGQKESSSDKCWVFWFGDHKISEVFKSRVYDFQKHFERFYNPKNSKKCYVNGIYEALTECWIRINKSESIIERNNLLQWSFDEFMNVQMFKDQSYTGPAVPEWVTLVLEKYSAEKIEEIGYRCKNLEKNISGNFTGISDLCMACKINFGQSDHPFFKGNLCNPCRDRLVNVIFMFDRDGFNTFCIICACSGELFLCDQDGCNKAYCYACLMFFIGETKVLQIKRKDIWLCFLCFIEKECELRARVEWREYLSLMFQPNPAIAPVNKLCIRILSLFDGIATGKLVLDELNIKMEVYYASEIDTDSLLVSKMRHSGGKVQWIGDVTSISNEKLHELAPIDLLIGGSPCNDFSIANPCRKGLDEGGTGVLFYEFYRILTTLREMQTPGRPLLWMFENVASMQKHCRSTISRFFNVLL